MIQRKFTIKEQREHLVRRLSQEKTSDLVPTKIKKELTPKQLEQRRNNLKKIAQQRRAATHCKKGHPLSGDNLRIKPSTGCRYCFTCKQDNQFYWRLSRDIRKTIEKKNASRS